MSTGSDYVTPEFRELVIKAFDDHRKTLSPLHQITPEEIAMTMLQHHEREVTLQIARLVGIVVNERASAIFCENSSCAKVIHLPDRS